MKSTTDEVRAFSKYSPVAKEAELPVVADPEVAGDWIAVHIFYSSNNHPLLVEVIGPLIEEFRTEGILDRWFFIRYWMEGPHIRVRLRPRRAGDTERIARKLFEALDKFLAERPALYEVDDMENAELFKEMFLGEYSLEQWNELYGTTGVMRMRPNNSYMVMEYEPEIGRYGGPSAIDIAEWHFEKSSDMVVQLESSANVHIRPVLFGLASQLMVIMLGVFLGSRSAAAQFLSSYRTYWERSSADDASPRHDAYGDAYEVMRAELEDHILSVFDNSCKQVSGHFTGFLNSWTEHCVELRARLSRIDSRGDLLFPIGSVKPVAVPFQVSLAALLSGYIHMTNNRLGISIIDECYISYLLERVLNYGEEVVVEESLEYMFGGTGADR